MRSEEYDGVCSASPGAVHTRSCDFVPRLPPDAVPGTYAQGKLWRGGTHGHRGPRRGSRKQWGHPTAHSGSIKRIWNHVVLTCVVLVAVTLLVCRHFPQ